MPNIRVDVGYTIKDGSEIKFKSPVDCSVITGLVVYYPTDEGKTVSKVFAFADAHGNNVGDIDHLFAENVVVKVILDVTTGMAFVQNADTNTYLENRFNELSDCIINTSCGEVVSVKDSTNRLFRGLTVYGKTTQNGTPSPESPVLLESAGDSGSVVVSVTGKNIFGGDALADKFVSEAKATKDEANRTITYTPANVNTKVLFRFSNLNPNARYTIILFGSSSVDGATQTNIGINYTDGTSTTINFKAGSNYAIFTTDSGKTPKSMYGAWLRGNVTLYYDKCGIFEGVLTKADFEPYIPAQTLTIQTPNGLPGINEIVRDCKDYGSGTQTQMVGKIDSYAGEEITGAYISSTGELSNGATVLYELPEPIETPIPAEEMAQYAALHTNKPNTTIFNDAGAHMEVEYVADTKMYIDNKFTELQNAILATGANV